MDEASHSTSKTGWGREGAMQLYNHFKLSIGSLPTIFRPFLSSLAFLWAVRENGVTPAPYAS